MKTTLKKLIIFFFLLSVLAGGCGIPGSPNMPVEDDSVTITGKVVPPEVGSAAILGSVSSALVLDAIVKSGICKVNGSKVEFSLNQSSGEIKIEKLPPAVGYVISLGCGSLELAAYIPHTGRRMVLGSGLSLDSTAEYLILDNYARQLYLKPINIADYSVSSTEKKLLVATLKNELEKNSVTRSSLDAAVSNYLNNLNSRKHFTEVLEKNGATFDFAGKWTGEVNYSIYNSSGAAIAIVQAMATFNISCSGSNLTGYADISPVSLYPLVLDPAELPTPSKIAFSFNGTCRGGFAWFTRKGILGPLNGRDIDKWVLMPVNCGIGFGIENLDTAYYTGIHSNPGDFRLENSSD
ncbi:MAG: hypothetical protein Kow0029_21420 [Candidatus Rifleibacteriota bacterium]